jgi:hypothetical protein
MINSNYDLDSLITNAIIRGFKDVKRYNIDDTTVVFTAGNLAAKFRVGNNQLIAVGDAFEGGHIDWSKCEADSQWASWKLLSLDAIQKGEFDY